MSNIYLGMDVHQQSITLAILPAGAAAPTVVEQIPNEAGPLRRRLAPLAEAGPRPVTRTAPRRLAAHPPLPCSGTRRPAPTRPRARVLRARSKIATSAVTLHYYRVGQLGSVGRAAFTKSERGRAPRRAFQAGR